MAQPLKLASQGSLTGSAKLKAVTSLMDQLTVDLGSMSLLASERDTALEELKVYGRDPRFADPIFTRSGIETLAKHAFDSQSDITSRHAMRVLCNTMFLKESTRQMFVDLGYEEKACEKLKNDDRDDEFLVSRIIFLTTYGTNISLATLVEKFQLAESITQNLARHAERFSSKASDAKQNPMVDMALTETAKLLFNVTHFSAKHVADFTPAIPHIVKLLYTHDVPSKSAPLTTPIGSLVNALLNLELASSDIQPALFPESSPKVLAERLLELLDLSMKSYSDLELEQSVSPLVGVLGKIYGVAPDSIREAIRDKLLPTEEDRKNVLGQGSTLSSRLLRNSTSPAAPELGKAISNLFFDLSDRDPSKFVQNVGYGFASGFLFQNNLPIPQAASETLTVGGKKEINPITGQFLDAEKFPDTPEMTEEEKEREAERLFVLFERLRKNGMISVENPIAQAVREGRFEEVDDNGDAVEELD